MNNFLIKKGLDLKITGAAKKTLISSSFPKTIAIMPSEFKGLKPKLLVNEQKKIKGGQPLFFDKNEPDIKIVSPIAGKISKITFGERQVIKSIIIEPDWEGEHIKFEEKTSNDLNKMSRNEIIKLLQNAGLFIYLRQRPFDIIPNANCVPKSIFVNAMDSAPNAGDPAFILKNKQEELELGLSLLSKLTNGKVNLCYSSKKSSSFLNTLKYSTHYTFEGPHPAGLVGTHIHFVDPINKGETVWYINAAHLAEIGAFLKSGKFSPERIICLAGSGAKEQKYIKSFIGASVRSIIYDKLVDNNQRIINGTVLYGNKLNLDEHIGFYESNLQIIQEGHAKEFMGWAMPGIKKFSASSRVFLSSILPSKNWNFNTNIRGSHRPIIWTDVYDNVTPLDIYTNFLVKAILAKDIEECESLGILEVSEEDFALATYICPSKIDISSIIQIGLNMMVKEGY